MSIALQQIQDFSQALREAGYRHGVAESVDLCRCLSEATTYPIAKAQSRALMTSNARQWHDFDEHFDRFGAMPATKPRPRKPPKQRPPCP